MTWRILRSTIALVVMIAAFSAPDTVHSIVPATQHLLEVMRVAAAIIALVAGIVAIRGWLGLIFHSIDRQAGVVLRNLGTWALYACLLLALLSLLGVNLSGLLVGGAILGVVIGAAAQSSLGNFFAGILLMMVRPFEIGVTLRVRTSIAGTIEFEGTVIDTNALYTTLRTPRGELLRLPNQVVMNSALTVGKPPLQGSIQATVPATHSLATLRSEIHDQLPDRSAQIVVIPTIVTPNPDGPASVLCQIEVRSRRTIDEATLIQAVTLALREKPVEPGAQEAVEAATRE